MGSGRGKARRARDVGVADDGASSIVSPEPIVLADGTREWRANGDVLQGPLHRVGGPAVESANGDKQWYELGKLHRVGGPAWEYADGGHTWWENGELHRQDGPAVEFVNGTKEWWLEGKMHRQDGPARECEDGSKEWWLYGVRATDQEIAQIQVNIRLEEMKLNPLEKVSF